MAVLFPKQLIFERSVSCGSVVRYLGPAVMMLRHKMGPCLISAKNSNLLRLQHDGRLSTLLENFFLFLYSTQVSRESVPCLSQLLLHSRIG